MFNDTNGEGLQIPESVCDERGLKRNKEGELTLYRKVAAKRIRWKIRDGATLRYPFGARNPTV